MLMPGRTYSSDKYRYGFNGQEQSTELNMNLYNAEYWQYDSRTGRRWNVDPRPNTSNSLYSVLENSPLLFNDPFGDTLRVTTKGGGFLFNLDDGAKDITTLTAKQLYDKGTQWFEPLADNYMPIININENISKLSELKHFLWSDIDAFASIDRWMLSYRQNGPGDWKADGKPADGYLMVTVNGQPYWADAVGQIPFAVDYFTDRLESHGDKDKAIKETIQKGREYGEGKLVGGVTDKSNSYDIYFILRAALYAANKYQATESMWSYDVKPKSPALSPNYLGERIWYKDAMPFLGLNPNPKKK